MSVKYKFLKKIGKNIAVIIEYLLYFLFKIITIGY